MHPAIERLAEIGTRDELTTAQAAYVLARGEDFIARAIKRSQIEGRAENCRGGSVLRRYLIPPAAVVLYLIRSTPGPKEILLESIQTHIPQLHEWASQTANSLRFSDSPPKPPQTKTKRTTPADPTDSPDLFADAWDAKTGQWRI